MICNLCSYILTLFSEPSQLWKIGKDFKLANKANVWQSVDKWEFVKNDDKTMFYIRNIDKSKVLEVLDDNLVDCADFVENKADQLWKKGDTMEGYFTLKSFELSKVMTAISETKIEVKGILLYILMPITDK